MRQHDRRRPPAPANALPASYASLSAAEKLKALSALIGTGEYCSTASYADPGCALPHGRSFSSKALPSLFSLATTFDTVSDEMPEGRRKLLRPSGIVATFTFEASYPDVPTVRALLRRPRRHRPPLRLGGAHEDRQDLHSLEPGTVVYDVLARAASTDRPSSREKIGEITLTSRPIATKAADERLFFQHHRGPRP